MAAYIIGMQKIASLALQKNRVVEQGFLGFFQDDGQLGRSAHLVSSPVPNQLEANGDWKYVPRYMTSV
jgi:hypothetical protein